jgi:hypothetical protein
LINSDGEATTQVLEPIEKKTFIFDKQFNNGITSKLTWYKIIVKSLLRLVTLTVNLPYFHFHAHKPLCAKKPKAIVHID